MSASLVGSEMCIRDRLQTLRSMLSRGLESDAIHARASSKAGVPQEGTAPGHVIAHGSLGSHPREAARWLRPSPVQ
eukprot:4277639-Alexandrium_andersonii.AAC.1